MIKPYNNIVLAELVRDIEPESSIVLPDAHIGRFIHLKILAKGDLVEHIEVGDIVIANAVLEIIDKKNPKVGFINMKDILGKVGE